MRVRGKVLVSIAVALAVLAPTTGGAEPQSTAGPPRRIATGLAGGGGSTIGPDGALYVTENAAGRVSRVDPRSGEVTTFASGLPGLVDVIGGLMDVAFIGETAYVLVTLVGEDIGGDDVVGIYRIDGPDTSTVIADIGRWSMDHPSKTEFFVPTGVQYAMEARQTGFFVTDGHHNRVLWVALDGAIHEVRTFDNIVPTGLAMHDEVTLMAFAGAVPHPREGGGVVSFLWSASGTEPVGAGGGLLVDVEICRDRRAFVLSQGVGVPGAPDGAPAQPDTGQLLRLYRGGSTVVVDGLDRPTSLELVDTTAFIVTLTGDVWRIKGLACPPLPA